MLTESSVCSPAHVCTCASGHVDSRERQIYWPIDTCASFPISKIKTARCATSPIYNTTVQRPSKLSSLESLSNYPFKTIKTAIMGWFSDGQSLRAAFFSRSWTTTDHILVSDSDHVQSMQQFQPIDNKPELSHELIAGAAGYYAAGYYAAGKHEEHCEANAKDVCPTKVPFFQIFKMAEPAAENCFDRERVQRDAMSQPSLCSTSSTASRATNSTSRNHPVQDRSSLAGQDKDR
jgi:hypothetical protein